MYAQVKNKSQRKPMTRSSPLPVQRVPLWRYVNGITHLVLLSDTGSLFDGTQVGTLFGNEKIEVDGSQCMRSRRGPNQEITSYREHDRMSPAQYLWIRVLSVNDKDYSSRPIYVRWDVLTRAPSAGEPVLSNAPSLGINYTAPQPASFTPGSRMPERIAYELSVGARSMNRIARGYNSYDSSKGATPHIAAMEKENTIYIAGNTGDQFSFAEFPSLLEGLKAHLLSQEDADAKKYYNLKKHNTFINNFNSQISDSRLREANIPDAAQSPEEIYQALKEAYKIIKSNREVLEGDGQRYTAGDNYKKRMCENMKRCIQNVALAVKMYLKLYLQSVGQYHPNIGGSLMDAEKTFLAAGSPVNVGTKYLTDTFKASYKPGSESHQHGEMLLLDILYFSMDERTLENRARLRQIFIGGSLLDCLFCHWSHALFNKYVGPVLGIQVVTSGTHGNVPTKVWRVPLWMRAERRENKMALEELKRKILDLRGWVFCEESFLFKFSDGKAQHVLADTAPDDSDSDIE